MATEHFDTLTDVISSLLAEADEANTIVVHRPYDGRDDEHEESDDCWCVPVRLRDGMTIEDIEGAIKPRAN